MGGLVSHYIASITQISYNLAETWVKADFILLSRGSKLILDTYTLSDHRNGGRKRPKNSAAQKLKIDLQAQK